MDREEVEATIRRCKADRAKMSEEQWSQWNDKVAEEMESIEHSHPALFEWCLSMGDKFTVILYGRKARDIQIVQSVFEAYVKSGNDYSAGLHLLKKEIVKAIQQGE